MNQTTKTLHQVIAEKGLQYKAVADLVKCTTEHVCADAGKRRLSAERAVKYGRALGIDPHEFRPDVFQAGEFIINAG
jgi:DNA-binding transcriptional regulator YdaS (Cro superfamily)